MITETVFAYRNRLYGIEGNPAGDIPLSWDTICSCHSDGTSMLISDIMYMVVDPVSNCHKGWI